MTPQPSHPGRAGWRGRARAIQPMTFRYRPDRGGHGGGRVPPRRGRTTPRWRSRASTRGPPTGRARVRAPTTACRSTRRSTGLLASRHRCGDPRHPARRPRRDRRRLRRRRHARADREAAGAHAPPPPRLWWRAMGAVPYGVVLQHRMRPASQAARTLIDGGDARRGADAARRRAVVARPVVLRRARPRHLRARRRRRAADAGHPRAGSGAVAGGRRR